MRENGWVGILLPIDMATAIQMFRDFLNFEQLQLLHYLECQPDICSDTSKWGYLHSFL